MNRAISQPWKEAEGTKVEMDHYSHDLSQHRVPPGGHRVTGGLGWAGLEGTFKVHLVQPPAMHRDIFH